MNLRKKTDTQNVYTGDRKRDQGPTAKADDLHLGAYWEHQKDGALGQDKDGEYEFDKKPFSIRVVGIPGIENIQIARSWTIEEIKFTLAKESGIRHDDIDVYFGGQKLLGEMVVFNCAILPDSIVTVVLHSRL